MFAFHPSLPLRIHHIQNPSSHRLRPRIQLHLSNPNEISKPSRPFRLPQLRPSPTPIPAHKRLERVRTAVNIMYLPAIALLATRIFQTPPPLHLVQLSLLITSPALLQSSLTNLQNCAAVARRTSPRNAERLKRPVQVHSALTSIVAAGTLSGLFCSLVDAVGGVRVALIFQLVFYVARRVRFERGGKVYRCDHGQYRDVVWACAFAFACVELVARGVFPWIASSILVFLAVAFWVLKWIFVPSSEQQF